MGIQVSRIKEAMHIQGTSNRCMVRSSMFNCCGITIELGGGVDPRKERYHRNDGAGYFSIIPGKYKYQLLALVYMAHFALIDDLATVIYMIVLARPSSV